MAATLRPETMYGQVNCWVLPDGQYAAFAARARPYVENGYEPGATQVRPHPQAVSSHRPCLCWHHSRPSFHSPLEI